MDTDKQTPKKTEPPIPEQLMPRHIGFIMDGNGRWAKKRGLPRELGHEAGAATFKKIVRYCRDIGVPCVTFYAFSTENWKRPKHEVEALMKLLGRYLQDSKNYRTENARLKVIGDVSGLPEGLRELIGEAERYSAAHTGITVNLAINYGGRDELTRAVREISRRCLEGEIAVGDIDEALISDSLDTAGQPDPDLIIRPSGEKRTSNFLPWQAAYSELVFMDVLWPDFSEKDVDAALLEYARRDRRFGGAK